jgi:hypothetical protein
MSFLMSSCASVTAPSSTPQVGQEVTGCGSAGRRGLAIRSWLGLTAGGGGMVESEEEGGLSISSCSSMGNAPWRLSNLAMRSDRMATTITENKQEKKKRQKEMQIT